MDCGTPQLLLNSTKIIMDTYNDNVDENRVFEKEVIIKPPVFIGKNVKIQIAAGCRF